MLSWELIELSIVFVMGILKFNLYIVGEFGDNIEICYLIKDM